jgi:hypothetical protein
MTKRPLVILFAAVTVSAQAQFFDDFNRADGTNMGSNWTEQSGDFFIAGGRATTNGVAATSWMSVNGFSAAPGSVVVSGDAYETGAAVTYVSLNFGVLSGTQELFVKIQDNNADGALDRVFFYYGNNGSSGSLGSFVLAVPTASAHFATYLTDPNTIKVDIDRNFDSVVDESFSATGVSAFTLGTGFGAGIYGQGALDNYRVTGVPEPATLAGIGLGIIALLRRRRK